MCFIYGCSHGSLAVIFSRRNERTHALFEPSGALQTLKLYTGFVAFSLTYHSWCTFNVCEKTKYNSLSIIVTLFSGESSNPNPKALPFIIAFIHSFSVPVTIPTRLFIREEWISVSTRLEKSLKIALSGLAELWTKLLRDTSSSFGRELLERS